MKMYLLSTPLLVAIVGCGAAEDGATVDEPLGSASQAVTGRNDFRTETFDAFGTNGRTCETCHTLGRDEGDARSFGTLQPSDVQARFQQDPTEPLFRPIDADDSNNDGVLDQPISYNRLKAHATNRVLKALPAGVKLAQRVNGQVNILPATQVVLNRGIPGMFNTPGLDALAMYDGRFGRMDCVPNIFDPNILTVQAGQRCTPREDIDGVAGYTNADRRFKLREQAIGAIKAHFEPTTTPTEAQFVHVLNRIADFQSNRFAAGVATNNGGGALEFNTPQRRFLRKLADGDFTGGNLPTAEQVIDNFSNDSVLPAVDHGPDPLGTAEWRGRFAFLEGGFCGACHSGATLDTVPQDNPTALNRYNRFATIFSSVFNSVVSQRNAGNVGNFPQLNPVQTFAFDENNDGVYETVIDTADPGLALVTGKAADANRFRILPLWNTKHTAPYFHDNSARSPEEVVEHYDEFFNIISGPPGTFNSGGAVDIPDVAIWIDVNPDPNVEVLLPVLPGKSDIVAYLKLL